MKHNPPARSGTTGAPLLVLASTSPYRRAQMELLSQNWVACDPHYREEHDLALSPHRLAVHLALQKARSVADTYPDALIIGSDQILTSNGRVYLKPSGVEMACAQLESLSGREHLLVTSVVVLSSADGRMEWDLDVQRIRLRRLTRVAIRNYVVSEQPLDCVGALKIEGLGITLVESISGKDPTAVVGLPLVRLVTLLRKFGVRVV